MFFDSTRIYPRTLELVDIAKRVIEELPPGYAFLADQLRRASASCALNFAEGCGKETKRDRRRYFMAARGSAYEVAAVLDVGLHLGVIEAEVREHGHLVADHLAAMLTRFR
jgi:four helix bundle protein